LRLLFGTSFLLVGTALPAQEPLSFDRDIKPILHRSCEGSNCHLNRKQSGVEVTTHASLLGSLGEQYATPVVIPGDAAGSPLIDKVSNATPRFGQRMPLEGTALTVAEIATLREWTDAGAQNLPPPLRGDANSDRVRDISDPLFLLSFLFLGGRRPATLAHGDASSNGVIDIGDVVFLLNYLFWGGAAPRDDGGPPGALEVVLEAARTSGVAPLAVFCDATATVSPTTDRPFHELRFEWDFGDPGSGAWPHSGLSRNEAVGAVAGHVYEMPGTYIATLHVLDHDGNEGTRTIAIRVADPDQVFAGEKTICFSTAGDFTGAPPGARHMTTTSFSTIERQVAPGRRLLLRRGEVWSTRDSFTLNAAGPGIIGAFGPGAPPLIHLTGNQTFFVLSGEEPRLKDWRIMDLSIDGGTDPDSRAVRAAGTCSQMLLLRLEARDVHNGFSFNTSQLEHWYGEGLREHVLYDQIAIVDCTTNRVIGGAGGYGSMLAGRRVLFLGNTYDDTRAAEHVVRTPILQKAVMSHNDLRRPANSKHVLKLHAPPFNDPGVVQGQHTELVIVSHNTLQGDDSAWTLAASPEDGHTDQRLRDVIIEGNHFLAGSGTQIAIYLGGQGVTVRNNLIDCTGGSGHSAVAISQRGIEPAPLDIAIFNNTAYSADRDELTLLRVDSAAARTRVFNNLVAAPSSTRRVLIEGSDIGLERGSNLLTATPGFVAARPSSPEDFRLQPQSPAVDAGTEVQGVWTDFEGNERPAEGHGAGSYDLGAFEYVP
jgi:hypothetical protein